ncbi:hypothetical protein X739_20370 [Mesorhizobium sp. LNHC220B00]|nr:hypothetical protein X739_20370 [Mesorhizobium sp. LNHC220B00]ESY96721.1 hypothetical protein X741_07480 [Mesorhizobium sp. LNHC229A00]ESY98090.1 hypothetical protein X738_18990 [Mesorhizobium sp. LNHC209A00]
MRPVAWPPKALAVDISLPDEKECALRRAALDR